MTKGFFAHGVLNLTPKESYELSLEGAVIIDVRESYMSNFKMFNVENLIYAPLSELKNFYQNLPTDRTLIFTDAVGLKSREAVVFMKERGYDNVANMAGGIVDWERDGLPLTTDISARLSGSCMCQLKPGERRSQKGNEGEKGRGGESGKKYNRKDF